MSPRETVDANARREAVALGSVSSASAHNSPSRHALGRGSFSVTCTTRAATYSPLSGSSRYAYPEQVGACSTVHLGDDGRELGYLPVASGWSPASKVGADRPLQLLSPTR